MKRNGRVNETLIDPSKPSVENEMRSARKCSKNGARVEVCGMVALSTQHSPLSTRDECSRTSQSLQRNLSVERPLGRNTISNQMYVVARLEKVKGSLLDADVGLHGKRHGG